jgi:hypothetical protein
MQLLMATQSHGDDVPERELPWIGFAEAPTDPWTDYLRWIGAHGRPKQTSFLLINSINTLALQSTVAFYLYSA